MKIDNTDMASRIPAAMPRVEKAPDAEPDGDQDDRAAKVQNAPAAQKIEASDPQMGTKVNLFA
jgi:hypothetical protein